MNWRNVDVKFCNGFPEICQVASQFQYQLEKGDAKSCDFHKAFQEPLREVEYSWIKPIAQYSA